MNRTTESRRITQIAVSAGDKEIYDLLYALANDGTLWYRKMREDSPWICIESLPQPPTPEPENI